MNLMNLSNSKRLALPLAAVVLTTVLLGVILISAANAAQDAPGSIPHFGPVVITSHTPMANALDVSSNITITAVFSATMDASTINTGTFTLRSEMTGVYSGTFSFPALDELAFYPDQPFKPGEVLFVTGSSEVKSDQAAALKPTTWQFTAATGVANAWLDSHPGTPSFGSGYSRYVALGDLDADGDLDALVANTGAAQTVWENDGFGNYSSLTSFGAGSSMDVALGDLDGDRDLDAVVANNGTAQTVWLNNGDGTFATDPISPTFGAGESYGVGLGDLDGDGDLDAVVANYNQPQDVYLNDGIGIFTPHPISSTFGLGDRSFGLALGDLDADGDLDVVIANSNQPQTVWLNDGSGVFSPHSSTPTFGDGISHAILLGDLDDDYDLDAIVVNYNQEQTVWVNNGSGAFSPHLTTPTFGGLTSSHAAALGDLDGDGDLDVVLADSPSSEYVWLNNGSGVFSAHPTHPTFGAGRSYGVSMGDLDGDGDLDVVIANSLNQPETVWLNNLEYIYLPLVIRN